MEAAFFFTCCVVFLPLSAGRRGWIYIYIYTMCVYVHPHRHRHRHPHTHTSAPLALAWIASTHAWPPLSLTDQPAKP